MVEYIASDAQDDRNNQKLHPVPQGFCCLELQYIWAGILVETCPIPLEVVTRNNKHYSSQNGYTAPYKKNVFPYDRCKRTKPLQHHSTHPFIRDKNLIMGLFRKDQ